MSFSEMKKLLVILSIFLNIFEINSQELDFSYTVIIDDLPKDNYLDSNLASKQILFDFHDWIKNRDTTKVKIYTTEKNYIDNHPTSVESILLFIRSLDTISEVDLTTGEVHKVIFLSGIERLYFSSITFHEKWSISDFIKIESNYFTLNRFDSNYIMKNPEINFEKELKNIYVKNLTEIDKSKIDNSFTIEYIINLDSVNQSFFKSYLFCDSFIERNIEKGNFKMCFNDNRKMYISDINEYLLKINNYKDSSLFIGIRLREKWQWDEYGVFNKKILGYAPIVKIIRENQYIGQMPLFWIYPKKK